MLFAKLQRILELTKDYVVKHITFQMYRGVNSGLFLANMNQSHWRERQSGGSLLRVR